ncbi:DNA polymerase I, partial [bacterium]|nr:DNA polymerase I [bacterium]
MPQTVLKKPALFLIDSMSLAFQAFYAIRNLTNAEGMPTNAIYGFTRKVQKIIKDYKPTHLVATFDSPGPTFRNDIYQAYKANREEAPQEFRAQVPYLLKLLEAMGIPTVAKSGFEADDIIGTLTRKSSAQGLPAAIVSADKD